MQVVSKWGFSPYGVEISEYGASLAKRKFGDNKIFNGKLEDANFESNFFDTITMFDVLEHVYDPISTLKAVNPLLSKHNSAGGGTL